MSDTHTAETAEFPNSETFDGPANLEKLKKRSETLHSLFLKIIPELYRGVRANCRELPVRPQINVYHYENRGSRMSEGLHAGGMQSNYFDISMQFGSEEGCLIKARFSWGTPEVPPYRIRDALQESVKAINSAYNYLKKLPDDARMSLEDRQEEAARLIKKGVSTIGQEPPPPPRVIADATPSTQPVPSAPQKPLARLESPSTAEVEAVLGTKPKKFEKSKLTKEILAELSGKTQKEQIMILLWRLYVAGRVELRGALDAFEEAGIIPSRQVGSSLLSQLIGAGYITRIKKANRFNPGILELPENALEAFRKSWLGETVTQARSGSSTSRSADRGEEEYELEPQVLSEVVKPENDSSGVSKLLADRSLRLVEIDEELERVDLERKKLIEERSKLFIEIRSLVQKEREV